MAALAVGDRVGRYEVEALVGRGGMGAVYRARDTLLRRKVALKLVDAPADADEPSSGPDKAGARRILREARMVAAFDHPNVVALFDIGEHEGTPFIVMEYIEGRSLRAMAKGDVPLERRLGWTIDVARALSAAHKAGLVHRDVKLDNVMLRDDGVIKVLDFGIAAPPRPERGPGSRRPAPDLPDGEATFATVERGEIAGTPGYMAPEIFADGVFDARTDQFAWGVLAYRLLAGRPPWGKHPDTGAMLLDMAGRDADPLDAGALGLPSAVSAAIARALARSATERFASMAELLDGLNAGDATASAPLGPSARAAAEAPPVLESTELMPTAPRGARPSAPVARRGARSAPSRTRRRLLFAVLALGSITIGGAAALGIWRHPPPYLEITNMRRVAFGATYSEDPSLSADGAVLVYDAADDAGDQLYRLDLRTMQRARLTSGDAWSYAAAISPDGHRVAYLSQGSDQGAVYVMDLAGGTPARLVSRGSFHPRWSPDGTALWAGTSRRPVRFDAATFAETRALTVPPGTQLDELIELRDGRVVAIPQDASFSDGPGVIVYPRGSSEPTWIYRGEVGRAVDRAPGDRGILVAHQTPADGSELLFVPLDGSRPSRAAGSDLAPTSLSMSADGRRVAWSTAASRSALFALREGAPDAAEFAAKVLTEGRHWADARIRSLADGSGWLFVSTRGGQPGLWLEKQGEPPRAVAPGVVAESTPTVAADGQRVAVGRAGGGISVAPLGGGAALELTRDPGDSAPSFARDGSRIYFERRTGAASSSIRCVPVAGGPDVVVLAEKAIAPEASPTEDVLFYLEPTGRSTYTPRVLDLATGASRPLADLPPGRYMGLRSSLDGRRVAAYSTNHVTEIDVETGNILHHFESGISAITGATYTREGLLVTEERWDGDVWIADITVR